MKMTCHTDGGGAQGGISFAFHIEDPTGHTICRSSQEAYGEYTTNDAEYMALLSCLAFIDSFLGKKHPYTQIQVFMDSSLVCEQMNDVYQVKASNMQKWNTRCKELANKISTEKKVDIKYNHVKRDGNKEADRLARISLQ